MKKKYYPHYKIFQMFLQLSSNNGKLFFSEEVVRALQGKALHTLHTLLRENAVGTSSTPQYNLVTLINVPLKGHESWQHLSNMFKLNIVGKWQNVLILPSYELTV